MRAVAAIFFVSFFLAITDASATQKILASCSNNSRECLLAAAESYLQAVVTHDGSKALLAPGVRRTVEGGWLLVGEDAMRKSIDMEPDMLPARNTRYFVDEAQRTVILITLLPIKGANADSTRASHETGGQEATIHVVERFKVESGLISEIEVFFHKESGTTEGASGWPDST